MGTRHNIVHVSLKKHSWFSIGGFHPEIDKGFHPNIWRPDKECGN
mgnify:CR=1 FL=1